MNRQISAIKALKTLGVKIKKLSKLQSNKAISKRTGLCTYIIETTSMKLYKHKTTGGKIFRCMFMVAKYGNKGFDFGFSVVVDVRVINEGPRLEVPGFGQKKAYLLYFFVLFS